MPKSMVDKLAALYSAPAEDLLDGYNLFLYRGQPGQLRAYRQKLGLSRKEFAALTGLGESSIKAWETGRKVMRQGCWGKLMRALEKET